VLASRPNKYVFNFRQKVSTVKSVRRTSAGRLFQSRGPAAAKAPSPNRVLVVTLAQPGTGVGLFV